MNRATLALLAVLSVAFLPRVVVAGPAGDTGAVQMARLTEAFTDFAGSPANAQSLVEGLRDATAITLMDPSNAPKSFAPVTRPMNWREVRIALVIAQAELTGAGIAQPTPIDIEAVLNGGTAGSGATMTIFTGVLTQRSSGLGWQQIALAHNVNIDTLVTGASRPAGTDIARAASLGSIPLRHGAVAASARTVAAVVQ
ncbi:MAG TPA: hypothetical protein VLQ46_04360 [Casimicrobiaceae bacterium]|nr:hypothetical protein [Casimicrobiaceae bacterium]